MTGPGRREFPRITPESAREALSAHLEARGVPRHRLDAETDLAGLAGDITIRGLQGLSLVEAAEAAGLDPQEARQVWLTAGVAVGDDDDTAFTDEEVAVLRFYAAGRDLFGATAVLQGLRVIGSSLARVAETEVGVLRLAYEIPALEAGDSDIEVQEGYEHLTRVLLPAVESVFGPLHRLHLSRAVRRAWAVDEDSGVTLATVAVGFADLAGFTALAGQLRPAELAEVVDTFDDEVGHLVLSHGGQVVKLIGDEVMFVADDPEDGIHIARELADRLSIDHDLPAVRVGMAGGEVLSRDGDYYGSVVNLAARLVALAEPGQVLVDAELAEVAGSERVEPLAPVEVKGFADAVRAFRLTG